MVRIRTAGFFTKGIVYALMGVLTFLAAFGLGADISSREGVVDFLLVLPAGRIIGAIVALGLLAYSFWRLLQVFLRPRKNRTKPKSLKNLITRGRFLYSGLLYGFLAYSFGKPLVLEFLGIEKIYNPSEDDHQRQAALGEILSFDHGKILIWIIAGIVAIQAIMQFWLAFTKKFMKKIDHESDFKKEYDFISNLGKLGYAARGVVFGIISFFLVKVILLHNAKIYKGLHGSMQYLLTFSYGSALLGIVAFGLLAYGIFNIMVARHADWTRNQ